MGIFSKVRKVDNFRRIAQLLLVLAVIAIVVPGSGYGRFAGFPLDTLPELVALLILFAFAFSPDASTQLRQVLHRVSPAIRLLAIGLLLFVAIAKPVMRSSLPTTGGFDACYHSLFPSDDYPKPVCEPFFSRLGEGGRSRIDPVIDFHGWSYPRQDNYLIGSNWNLSFVNNPHFAGRYPPYEHVRHTFTADWSGHIEGSFESGVFPVVYTGKGVVDIDGDITYLPPNYGDPTVAWINIQRGRHSFRFTYEFNNPVNQAGITEPKSDLRGSYATVRVGAIRSDSRFTDLSIVGWAVDPATHTPIEFVEVFNRGTMLTRIKPSLLRADVWSYFKQPSRSDPLGFVIPDVPLDDGVTVSVRFGNGTTRKLAEVNHGELKVETNIEDDSFWFSIDQTLPPLHNFDALRPESGSRFAETFTTLIDIIITITVVAFGLFLARAYRHELTIIGLLMALVYAIHKWNGFPVGIGYDGVEGSSIIPTSLLLCAIILIPLCFVRRKAFLPVAIVGSLYLSIERTLDLNPGTRWDHFTPNSEQISNLGYTFFRSGYTDWLIHAWLTRGALFGNFLRGFEPVFYLQPGYRYIAPILHWGFGDGDIIITVMFFFGLSIAGFLLIDTVLRRSLSKIERLLCALLTLSLLFIMSSWVTSYFFLVQTTEIPTWSFTLIAFSLVLRAKTAFFRSFIPAILIGAAVVTRPNQLIGGLTAVLIILLLAQPQDENYFVRFRRWLLSISAFVCVSALPLLHNYYYGKQFVLFSTSRPGSLFEWDSLRNFLLGYIYQYRFRVPTETGIMGLPNDGASLTLEIGLYLLFLLWMFGLARLVWERPHSVRPWLYQFFPLAYLVPTFPYHAYFPRHAYIFWLAIFASVAITLSNRGNEMARPIVPQSQLTPDNESSDTPNSMMAPAIAGIEIELINSK